MWVKYKIKKALYIITLILICTINNFAAIVSDNDGTAFVTKSEFDALKKNFNKQIEDYNVSIDGKIEGSIAAYLSGIVKGETIDLAMPKSILQFPLTVYESSPFDYNKHYGEGAYNYATGEAQWTPHFEFATTITRRYDANVFTASNQNSNINTWDKFYNYTSTENIGTKKYAIISAIYDKYKAIYFANSWLMCMRNSAATLVNFNSYCVCGISAAFKNTGTNDVKYANGRTYDLVKSGTKFGTAGKGIYGTSLDFDYAVTYEQSSVAVQSLVNTSSTTRKWSTASGNGYQTATNKYNINPSWVIEYVNANVDGIYNNNGYYVPVSENGNVKLTNYHTAFRDLAAGTVVQLYAIGNRNKFADKKWTCKRYDTPNYTIADVDHCDKTDQFDTAFIKSDNIAYKVTDKKSGNTYTQPMTSGIFIGDMEKRGMLKLGLKMNYTGMVDAKVIVRKEPIPDVDLTNTKNIPIKYGTLIAQKFANIKSGMYTDISIEVEKGDSIYMKIINPTGVDVILEEPKLSLTTEGK